MCPTQRPPRVDDRIRLNMDVPRLSLRRGDVGVIRSTWFEPATTYEVEFDCVGLNCAVRALLLSDQIELAEAAAGVCAG